MVGVVVSEALPVTALRRDTKRVVRYFGPSLLPIATGAASLLVPAIRRELVRVSPRLSPVPPVRYQGATLSPILHTRIRSALEAGRLR